MKTSIHLHYYRHQKRSISTQFKVFWYLSAPWCMLSPFSSSVWRIRQTSFKYIFVILSSETKRQLDISKGHYFQWWTSLSVEYRVVVGSLNATTETNLQFEPSTHTIMFVQQNVHKNCTWFGFQWQALWRVTMWD